MKKVLILAVLLLGCSHSRHLTKSQKIDKADTLNVAKAEVKQSLSDSSQFLSHTSNLSVDKGKDMSIIESETKSSSEPIVLTGNFKIDTAAGGGIKLTSNGVTLTANYDKATGLIKAKVKVEGHGEQTTYTKQINIKDKTSIRAQDSIAEQKKRVNEILDSLSQIAASGSHLHAEKTKEVESKTKWPVLQLIGLGVLVALIVWVLAKRKTVIKWFKNKLIKK